MKASSSRLLTGHNKRAMTYGLCNNQLIIQHGQEVKILSGYDSALFFRSMEKEVEQEQDLS